MKKDVDDAMRRAVQLFEKSGMTLDQLGREMGHEGDVARKSAWQFLTKTTDPRLSMLERFAEALNVSLVDLVK